MAKAPSTKPADNWQEVFCKYLAQVPNVTLAARRAKISRSYAYAQRDADPAFAERWDDALEQSIDRAVGEAYRRAVDGVPKPVYQSGTLVGYVQEYSDGLLQFLLKSHRPDVYRDNATLELEHKGSIKNNVEHGVSPETAQSIFDVLAAAGVFGAGADDPEAE